MSNQSVGPPAVATSDLQFKLRQLFLVVTVSAIILAMGQWWGYRIAIPIAISGAAFSVLGVKCRQHLDVAASVRNQRLDWAWLSVNLAAAAVIAVFFFIETAVHDSRRGNVDSEYLFTLCFGAAIWSLVATLFVVGIPSRLAMNVFMKTRRLPYLRETIVLVVTFVALGWTFYILFTVRLEG